MCLSFVWNLRKLGRKSIRGTFWFTLFAEGFQSDQIGAQLLNKNTHIKDNRGFIEGLQNQQPFGGLFFSLSISFGIINQIGPIQLQDVDEIAQYKEKGGVKYSEGGLL